MPNKHCKYIKHFSNETDIIPYQVKSMRTSEHRPQFK